MKAGQVPQPAIVSFVAKAAADVTRHDRMVELVERMLALHKDLDAAKTPAQRTVIQRQIELTDRRIDQLVYELYGLTDEEIKIVEAES